MSATALVTAADDRTAFTKAIGSSRIWGFLEILRNSGIPEETLTADEVTMIIPIDTAFYRLAPEDYRKLLAPENKELAAQYIRAHVVKGRLTLEQLATGKHQTLGGGEIIVTSGSGEGSAASVNGNQVTLADQAGSVGMFHLIDGFLLKP